MFKKSDRVEVIEGRWKGTSGIIEHVIPIRVDGREIGERYGVSLEQANLPPNAPKNITLQIHQLKKLD